MLNSGDGITSSPAARTIALTCLAMIAFAANSVLCRMALGSDLIDPASFTSIRLIAGSVCLAVIVSAQHRHWRPGKPGWIPVLALFTYMACFSFAYQALDAGAGALLLFGCVQFTMIGTAIARGERLAPRGWLALTLAFAGLVYLLSPGLESPNPLYSALMAIAGIAWGIYSLWGSQGSDPTQSTASNFLFATPLAIAVSGVSAATLNNFQLSQAGVVLAIASGAFASGIGYAVWYSVLKHIKASTAAIVQLSVPAIATLGGAVFLAETISVRIVLATLLTIGGIALFLTRPAAPAQLTD